MSEKLPDIYVPKHALAHMDDTGMLSIASFANGDMRECYTPKANLKEAEERISCLESRLLLSDSNATWLQKEIERLKEFEYMYLANRSINHE